MGPGTARLFYELGLGRNFDDFEEARAGRFHEDFLVAGGWARGAWPLGDLSRHGKKAPGSITCVSGRATSRLVTASAACRGRKSSTPFFPGFMRRPTSPGLRSTPAVDRYLASLEQVRSNYAEAKAKCGM